MSCFVKLETRNFLIFITCEVIEVIQSIRNLNRSSIQKRAGEQLKDKRKKLTMQTNENQNLETTKMTFTKTSPPEWLLAFWKEIDDKTFGQDFDCFVEDATCRLGVAEWSGREVIRESLRAFIDTGFTALHNVTEYWDGGSIKVFRGVVTMTPDDRSKKVVKPVLTQNSLAVLSHPELLFLTIDFRGLRDGFYFQ